MTFSVVYDANVLYPNTLRDLLIRIAQSGTVQAKWTNYILDEMTAALRRTGICQPDRGTDGWLLLSGCSRTGSRFRTSPGRRVQRGR